MENPIKMDEFGGTTIFGNTHINHLHITHLERNIIFQNLLKRWMIPSRSLAVHPSSVGAHGRTGGQRGGNGGATNWGHGKRSLDENPYDAYDLWNKFQLNSAWDSESRIQHEWSKDGSNVFTHDLGWFNILWFMMNI